MIGIIVLLALSWAALYIFKRKSLLALGFTPPGQRLGLFITGFLFTAILCAAFRWLLVFLQSGSWSLNENASASLILNAFWWDFKSVLTEELVFRGALLYLVMQWLGEKKAILISALAFGVYHWFSTGVFGNLVPMVFILIGTGFIGYAWAYAFARTGSMLLPFGFHLGWNFTFNTIFSQGPLGELLLVSNIAEANSGWVSLLELSSWLFIVPLLTMLLIKKMNPVRT